MQTSKFIIFFATLLLCVMTPSANSQIEPRNVDGGAMQVCGLNPMTGWTRNGYCHTDERDRGVHVVCAQVTNEFLLFSRDRGNNLMDANPRFGFPGLKAGDHWCLCAARWVEAYNAKVAPPIKTEATHQKMLNFVSYDILKSFAIPNPKDLSR